MRMMKEKVNADPVLTWKVILRFTLTPIIMLGIFYFTAGRLDWWEVWAYMANFLVVAVGGRMLLLKRRPDQARERMEAGNKENVKSWDKKIVPLIALYLPFLSMAAAGLDKRFGWSPILPLGIRIAGLAVLIIGGSLANWALLTNRFFSSHVRIQTDRGHTVVDKGPYRVIRHPGYFGGLISWIAAPFFFSSWVVAAICVITIVLTFIRTALEDKVLQEELPGYKEYAQRVCYRLIPGIW